MTKQEKLYWMKELMTQKVLEFLPPGILCMDVQDEKIVIEFCVGKTTPMKVKSYIIGELIQNHFKSPWWMHHFSMDGGDDELILRFNEEAMVQDGPFIAWAEKLCNGVSEQEGYMWYHPANNPNDNYEIDHYLVNNWESYCEENFLNKKMFQRGVVKLNKGRWCS